MYNYQVRTATANITSVGAFMEAVQSMDDQRAWILWLKIFNKDRELGDQCYDAFGKAFGKRMLAYFACGKQCGGRSENWRHLYMLCPQNAYLRGEKTQFYKDMRREVLGKYAPHLAQQWVDVPRELLTPPAVYGEDEKFLGWLRSLAAMSPNSSEGKDLKYLIEMVEVLFMEATVA
jgi:hypothetical protein